MQNNLSKIFKLLTLVLLPLILLLNSANINAGVNIQHWQTNNGVKVLFVQAPEIPMLDVRIVFDAGSARDKGNSGLATLTNGLLAEGAGGLSSQQIAENFESVGAQISYTASRDNASIGVRSLTTKKHYLSTALKNLKMVLTQADFPKKAFSRELNRMKVSAKASLQSPASLAAQAFNRAVFGEHPYASPVSGDEKSLATINLPMVIKFYKKYYVSENAMLAMVGDVSLEQAKKIANDLVSGLAKGKKPEALPKVKDLTEAKKIIINFPSAQSHIFIGQPGTKRGDKDYFNLYVANHPFGGSGFSSRLVNVLREKNGLAYSVYSYFSSLKERGSFTVGMQTKASQTTKALNLLKQQLKQYIENGPTEEELAASLSNIVGSFVLKTDSNSKLLGYLIMIGFYDMPLDYLDKFIENVEAVKLEDIKQALKTRLNENKMVTVVVGNQ